jgi:hypothetical protein
MPPSLSGRLAAASRTRGIRLVAAGIGGTTLAGLAVLPASAHAVVPVAPYQVAIGWSNEPAYVGTGNNVELIVTGAAGKGVNDLATGALKAQVSIGGQTSQWLDLVSAFDPDTGLGTPGDYRAPLIPTVPGAYTFHVTGDIHGTKVDQSITASDKTFAVVTEPSSVQFPTTLPSQSSLSQLVDRTGARVAAAQKAADDASSSASHAMVIGVIALVAGVLLGGGGVALAMRRRSTA